MAAERTERNFVGEKYDPNVDRHYFLGGDVIEPLLGSDRSLGHLLVRIGLYSDVPTAFKEGWNRPIPVGWWRRPIGNLDLTIWNPRMTMEEAKEICEKARVNYDI